MYVQETVGHRCRSLPSTRGEAPVRSRENFRSTTSVGDVRACKGSRTARLSTQIGDDLGPLSCPHLAKRHLEVFWTYAPECGNRRKIADRKPLRIKNSKFSTTRVTHSALLFRLRASRWRRRASPPVSPLLHHQALDSLYVVKSLQFPIQNPKARIRCRSVGASRNAGFIEGDRFVNASSLL